MSESGRWGQERYTAGENNLGVNAITWAPPLSADCLLCPTPAGLSAGAAPGAAAAGAAAPPTTPAAAAATVDAAIATSKKRLAVGCCDGSVRIFELNEGIRQWTQAQLVGTHGDWVRGVAWAPQVASLRPRIASCAQDGSAAVWAFDATCGRWGQALLKVGAGEGTCGGAWKVEWNETGTAVVVSMGDGRVTVWMEALDGSNEWRMVNCIEEPKGTEAAAPSGSSFGSGAGGPGGPRMDGSSVNDFQQQQQQQQQQQFLF